MANKVRSDFTIVTSGAGTGTDFRVAGALTGLSGTAHLRFNAAGGGSTRRFYLNGFSQADMAATIFCIRKDNANPCHLQCRATATSPETTYLMTYSPASTVGLHKIVAGVITDLQWAAGVATSPGDVLEFQFLVKGTSLESYMRNVTTGGLLTLVNQITDSSIVAAGTAGFGSVVSNDFHDLDNFDVANVTAV